ncbi:MULTISPECIES: DHH family phosphoesterase [unclassified Thioalkalivibrio]|uniref:single-stranded-DNA-specific exonuclease RecJ n=1 Tax=unclassified Thioalkalivibrio TaxID=2621013 RepID=UPI000361E414|nr:MULTISPECIES: DHHA1 domain-containing protein [unclassified Thioalkalivibrio]
MMLQPQVTERPLDHDRLRAAKALGFSPAVTSVLARRATAAGVEPDSLVNLSLRNLEDPSGLSDISQAAGRIAHAIAQGEVIGLETDHDVDGTSSHAVMHRALTKAFGHPEHLIRHYIGLRLHEGYGISDSLCDRILNDSPRPSLIITADNGSSDEDRIARMKAEGGIDTVVTDHHGMEDGLGPPSAFACVSPLHRESKYSDRAIAGVMVAWLLMVETRRCMITRGLLPGDAPKLGTLLDYVSVGTVADCVSLSRSQNNRIVIRAGLSQINSNRRRVCWDPLIAANQEAGGGAPIRAEDLAFKVGPRINAVGRLDDAMKAVTFFLSEEPSSASDGYDLLSTMNSERQRIERGLTEVALAMAHHQHDQGRKLFVLLLESGHAGVHGIVASRVVEAFGHPVICLSPHAGNPDLLAGSCRSVPGFDMREALSRIANHRPNLLTKFGGHPGAAGLTLPRDHAQEFIELSEVLARPMMSGATLGPVLEHDGDLDPNEISTNLVNELSSLEPFGREFEPPVFRSVMKVATLRSMGAEGKHWQLGVEAGVGGTIRGVWFGAGTEPPAEEGQAYAFLYTPSINHWKGYQNLQVVIRGIDPSI